MIETTLPIRTTAEGNAREHWAQRAQRARCQKVAVQMGLMEHVRPRREALRASPLRILLVRIAPRLIDDDNVVSAMKAVRDGVVEALSRGKRGRGDGPRDGIAWSYAQEKSTRPHAYAIRIRIEVE